MAFEAALRTLLKVPAELGRATGRDGLHHPILGLRDDMGLPIGVSIKAQNVTDFP